MVFICRAKWDAWKRLGNMDREKAMVNYVNELKKIIETMSYTDNVAQFMGSIGELDGVDVNDLETVAPEVMKVAKSYPNSPFGKYPYKKHETIKIHSREGSVLHQSEMIVFVFIIFSYDGGIKHHLNVSEKSKMDH